MEAGTSDVEYDYQIHRLARQKREIRRLRNSVSFKLGLHLTNAIRYPWRLPFLPITFPIYCIKLGLERLGRIASPRFENDSYYPNEREDCIVLFPTNGVGFGHFTRMYAIAKEIRRKNEDKEIIFFTTMPTLHIPYLEGFPTYHLAGGKKFRDLSSSTWNMLVEEMLTIVLETHNPSHFVFDGSFPYRGMLNAIGGRQEITKIWMRRGMFRRGSRIPVDSIDYFDYIVHPGDAVSVDKSEIEHNVPTLFTPPITLLNDSDMLSKEDARKRLNIPLNAQLTYIQLGAGQINDIDSDIRLTINELLKKENMYIIIGESMLGERQIIEHDRVHLLRDYPNGLYFNAFDFSVQAGGYNSFHEMRKSRILTLFYPNMNTGMDDQLARCKISEKEGWGLVLTKRNKKTIHKAIDELTKMNIPDKFKELEENGSTIFVEKLVQV